MSGKEVYVMRKNHVNRLLVFVLFTCFCLSLTACGGGSSAPKSYKDGTYTGRSQDHRGDEDGNGAGYGEVTIEIKGNKIVSCTFAMYELDGKLKDDSYGTDLSKENRLKAQKAVQAAEKYAAKLVEGGTLDSVDAISGATISYSEFTEAVNDALGKAAVSN